MEREKFKFNYDGKKYILWTWKGDYLNFGPGGEAGLYYETPIKGIWSAGGGFSNVNNELSMGISIDYKNGESTFGYHPKEKQWWVTAFNPQLNEKQIDTGDIKMSLTIDFSDDPEMGKALYRSTKMRGDERWEFTNDYKEAVLTW